MTENKSNINWFPGHMAKALREMNEKIKLVDLIMILIDARLPYSSLNPELQKLFQNKKILYVFTKVDKADPILTAKWLQYYSKSGKVVAVDARNSKAIKIINKEALDLTKEKREKDAARGIKMRPIRTMIVGIPNVGKSTLINTLCGKKVVSVGDKPGITKSEQWIRINQTLELLDTPGVLWPKFDEESVGYNLAISGAINDDVLPLSDVGLYFMKFLLIFYPSSLKERYNIEISHIDDLNIEVIEQYLDKVAEIKKFYTFSKEYDKDKTAKFLLNEYRNNHLGRITLDRYEF